MIRAARIAFGCALLMCGTQPAHAALNPPVQCAQFDFVVGNWVVKDQNKRVVATDTVSKPNGNCTLIEVWRQAGTSSEGLAAMVYQSAENAWYRYALLRSPVVLTFKGRLSGRSIVMMATQYFDTGANTLHQMKWTPRSDGSVEEVWQTSTDHGKSWQLRFDEILTRIAE